MKNIEAGTAAPLFSTIGPIWLGHQPKKHVQPLDAVGSWQIILPMPKLERAY